MKQQPFICRGCGDRKTPDGKPKNAAFVWTDAKTKTRRRYCYACDDKLIQDLPLPQAKRTNRKEIER
jgi:hypothetical protein